MNETAIQKETKRQAVNPVEKLLSISKTLSNTIDSLMENCCENPEQFITKVKLLKEQLPGEDKKQPSSKDASEVSKLLRAFPGLSRLTLDFIKDKITEYKNLNVLNNYRYINELNDV
jgi:hypothetical protein